MHFECMLTFNELLLCVRNCAIDFTYNMFLNPQNNLGKKKEKEGRKKGRGKRKERKGKKKSGLNPCPIIDRKQTETWKFK